MFYYVRFRVRDSMRWRERLKPSRNTRRKNEQRKRTHWMRWEASVQQRTKHTHRWERMKGESRWVGVEIESSQAERGKRKSKSLLLCVGAWTGLRAMYISYHTCTSIVALFFSILMPNYRHTYTHSLSLFSHPSASLSPTIANHLHLFYN